MIFFWIKTINGRNVIIMKFKKIMSIMAVSAMCTALFAGCGNEETADGGSSEGAQYSIGVLQYAALRALSRDWTLRASAMS